MTDATAIIATERAELGYTEHPRGSNRTKYGAELGINAQPWCGTFQTWAYLHNGIDLRKYCDNPYYTPNLYGDLKALGWAVSPSKAGPADLMFYNWSGRRIQHVEAVVENRWPSMLVIGGNTSDHGGSQDNGGEVAQQTRPNRGMVGAIHVPMVAAAHDAAVDVLKALQAAIFYARQTWIGRPGDVNDPQAVRILQTGLNRWADRFAAMTGQPNPPDLVVNGLWDAPTRAAVVALQRLTGVNELGAVGPLTWAQIFG
jgi:peptidoglycan hydrolase-like protein with peptidoglycan-binding domain